MQVDVKSNSLTDMQPFLDKIMSLSHEMLDCCNNERWDDLVDIELKRRPLFVELTLICTSQEGLESIGIGFLHELLVIENKVQCSCENEKKVCQEKISRLSKGKTATNAYSSLA